MAKILLLEDERNLGATLKDELTDNGYEVFWATTHHEATQLLSQLRFDLAVLDVRLPDGSGFDLGAQIRKKFPLTAILFLTAMSSPDDRLKGFEIGAEDYITKPFHLKELLLRIEKVIGRSHELSSAPIKDWVEVGKAKVNFNTLELKSDDQIYHLSHREWAVLKFLYQSEGKPLSRDEIIDFAWDEDEYPSPRTIDNMISKLRKLIEVNPEKPESILSVRGLGYQLIRGSS